MSRIRSKNTQIELAVFSYLRKKKISFKKHAKVLGNPDIAVAPSKRAVFIDGDFWHGWKFNKRKGKLPPYWREKILNNMRRDRRNRRKLKAAGWSIFKVWEHELEAKNKNSTLKKIAEFLSKR